MSTPWSFTYLKNLFSVTTMCTRTHTTVVSITVDSLHKGNAFGKLAKLNNVNKWERYGFDSNMAKSAQQQHTQRRRNEKRRNNKQIYESIFTAISFMVNCEAHWTQSKSLFLKIVCEIFRFLVIITLSLNKNVDKIAFSREVFAHACTSAIDLKMIDGYIFFAPIFSIKWLNWLKQRGKIQFKCATIKAIKPNSFYSFCGWIL